MKEFIIYGLIDPRTNKICYIGVTKRGLKTRLREHNNPKTELTTILSKVSRYLITKKLKFSGIILYENLSRGEAEKMEIKLIKKYKKTNKLYNEKPGGRIGFQSERSKKQISNARKNHPNLNIPKGENHPSTIINNQQIISIYNLIKKHYSNNEIIQILNLPVGTGSITNYRYGITWGWFWKQHFKYPYPDFPSKKNGVSFRIKLKIIELLDKGYTIEHISKWIKRVNKYDIKYASTKKIWSKVWDIYEYHKQQKININK
jgi:hypothetical protein